MHLNSNGQPFCCKLFQLSKVTFNVQGPNNYKSTIKCPFFLKDLNFLCAKFDAHGNSESMQTTYRIRKSYYYHRYYQKYADFDIFFCTFFCRTLVSRDADCHSSCGGSGGNHPDHLDLHFVCSKGRNVLLPHGSLWKAKTVRYREVRNGKIGSNNKNGQENSTLYFRLESFFFCFIPQKKD